MNTTTEGWYPQVCGCHLQHKFQEGPDAPAKDTADNPIEYCSTEEATLIRKDKHERRVAQYRVEGDASGLSTETHWWTRQPPYEQTMCPNHSDLNGANHYAICRDESARQNIAWNIIKIVHIDREYRDLVFSWIGRNDQRVLHVQGSSFDPGIQATVDLQFGPNKVLIG